MPTSKKARAKKLKEAQGDADYERALLLEYAEEDIAVLKKKLRESRAHARELAKLDFDAIDKLCAAAHAHCQVMGTEEAWASIRSEGEALKKALIRAKLHIESLGTTKVPDASYIAEVLNHLRYI